CFAPGGFLGFVFVVCSARILISLGCVCTIPSHHLLLAVLSDGLFFPQFRLYIVFG
ncbi:hypothetical protein C8R47DRAFT_1138083, partial [Mycena vitilis]